MLNFRYVVAENIMQFEDICEIILKKRVENPVIVDLVIDERMIITIPIAKMESE